MLPSPGPRLPPRASSPGPSSPCPLPSPPVPPPPGPSPPCLPFPSPPYPPPGPLPPCSPRLSPPQDPIPVLPPRGPLPRAPSPRPSPQCPLSRGPLPQCPPPRSLSPRVPLPGGPPPGPLSLVLPSRAPSPRCSSLGPYPRAPLPGAPSLWCSPDLSSAPPLGPSPQCLLSLVLPSQAPPSGAPLPLMPPLPRPLSLVLSHPQGPPQSLLQPSSGLPGYSSQSALFLKLPRFEGREPRLSQLPPTFPRPLTANPLRACPWPPLSGPSPSLVPTSSVHTSVRGDWPPVTPCGRGSHLSSTLAGAAAAQLSIPFCNTFYLTLQTHRCHFKRRWLSGSRPEGRSQTRPPQNVTVTELPSDH